jgi:hypothetical protein
MGFRPRPKRFLLTFTGDLEGLEVETLSIPLGRSRELMDSPPAESVMENDDRWFAALIERTYRWNLEGEDGEVLPISIESLSNALDRADAKVLLTAWVGKCLGQEVPRPLEMPSPDGATTDRTPDIEASLPMTETSSASQAS